MLNESCDNDNLIGNSILFLTGLFIPRSSASQSALHMEDAH